MLTWRLRLVRPDSKRGRATCAPFRSTQISYAALAAAAMRCACCSCIVLRVQLKRLRKGARMLVCVMEVCEGGEAGSRRRRRCCCCWACRRRARLLLATTLAGGTQSHKGRAMQRAQQQIYTSTHAQAIYSSSRARRKKLNISMITAAEGATSSSMTLAEMLCQAQHKRGPDKSQRRRRRMSHERSPGFTFADSTCRSIDIARARCRLNIQVSDARISGASGSSRPASVRA